MTIKCMKELLTEHELAMVLYNITTHLPTIEGIVFENIIENCIENLSEEDVKNLTEIIIEDLDEYDEELNG